VAFDEHKDVAILEDPAHVILHRFGAAPEDVSAAGLKEHIVESRLVGEFVDALRRRSSAGR
jgi:hypothetical protein